MQQLIDFAANNIILVSAFFIILFLLVRSYIVPAGAKSVTASEAVRLINHNNALVLDVRTAEDFVGEQGHIDSAVNIAVEELQDRMDELADDLERPIAIVCRTDKRSAKAALLLTEQGFHDVHVVRGGMTEWIESGLPVVR